MHEFDISSSLNKTLNLGEFWKDYKENVEDQFSGRVKL